MVEKIEWQEAYRTDVAEIDSQHKQLFDLFNSLLDTRTQGEMNINATVEQLINYAVNHFHTEERLFKLCNYKDAESHIAMHNDFVNEVVTIKDKIRGADPRVTDDIVNFLKAWLITHVSGSDQDYVATFKAHGIS